jgi:hypothetical protein
MPHQANSWAHVENSAIALGPLTTRRAAERPRSQVLVDALGGSDARQHGALGLRPAGWVALSMH